MENKLRFEKRMAKKAADELHYENVMQDVMERIDQAKNLTEINRVLKACRNMM